MTSLLRMRGVTMANKQVGYDCSFVEHLPSDFQSECSICLHVLREPYLVGCCGYRFCRSCIEPIQKTRKRSCPLCKDRLFTSFPDKLLGRILSEKMVYCTHKSDGCLWKGKLIELEDHISVKTKEGGCDFVKTKCSFCDKLFCRHAMKEHTDVCPLRPMPCKYCEAHTDIISNLETKHYDTCPMFPVPCTNNCEAMLARKNLQKHIKEDCPRTVVECGYRLMGCNIKLGRKEMKVHEECDNIDHLSLAALKIADLEEKNAYLERELELWEKDESEDSFLSSEGSDLEAAAMVKPIKYIRVTNLPPTANRHNLNCRFGQFGYVKSIKMNVFGSRSARIEFCKESSSQNCLSSSVINLKNYQLCVDPEY